jgi:hypothetical protein
MIEKDHRRSFRSDNRAFCCDLVSRTATHRHPIQCAIHYRFFEVCRLSHHAYIIDRANAAGGRKFGRFTVK